MPKRAVVADACTPVRRSRAKDRPAGNAGVPVVAAAFRGSDDLYRELFAAFWWND